MLNHFGTPEDLPLRLYPTTACNFRCRTPLSTIYCDHIYPLTSAPTVNDLVHIFKLFHEANLSKIVKISGREPTLYKEIVPLVSQLSPIADKITLSTNGSADPELMEKIIRAGVSTITITIPSLDPEKFAFFTGLSPILAKETVKKILNLIDTLSDLNVKVHLTRVLIKDFNDSEQDIEEFLKFSNAHGAVAKFFELNFHDRLNQMYNSTKTLKSSARDVWENLFVDFTSLKHKWEQSATKIEKYENIFSPRIVYQIELPDGTQVLFDEYRPFQKMMPGCIECPQQGQCHEGPYSNGWELRADLQIQVCPLREDKLINLQQPEEIESIWFEDGDLHVTRANH